MRNCLVVFVLPYSQKDFIITGQGQEYRVYAPVTCTIGEEYYILTAEIIVKSPNTEKQEIRVVKLIDTQGTETDPNLAIDIDFMEDDYIDPKTGLPVLYACCSKKYLMDKISEYIEEGNKHAV